MRRTLKFIGLLTAVLASSTQADSIPAPDRVDIFTTSAIQVSGVADGRGRFGTDTIHVHEIDGIEAVTEMMGCDLPAAAHAAKIEATKRLQRFGKRERQRLQHAAEALVLAWQYQLTRYPSVVVDGRWVIYGVTDLNVALAIWRNRDKAVIR